MIRLQYLLFAVGLWIAAHTPISLLGLVSLRQLLNGPKLLKRTPQSTTAGRLITPLRTRITTLRTVAYVGSILPMSVFATAVAGAIMMVRLILMGNRNSLLLTG